MKRDTEAIHIKIDTELLERIRQYAEVDERTIAREINVLCREAIAARRAKAMRGTHKIAAVEVE